jgi:hypothetical protein
MFGMQGSSWVADFFWKKMKTAGDGKPKTMSAVEKKSDVWKRGVSFFIDDVCIAAVCEGGNYIRSAVLQKLVDSTMRFQGPVVEPESIEEKRWLVDGIYSVMVSKNQAEVGQACDGKFVFSEAMRIEESLISVKKNRSTQRLLCDTVAIKIKYGNRMVWKSYEWNVLEERNSLVCAIETLICRQLCKLVQYAAPDLPKQEGEVFLLNDRPVLIKDEGRIIGFGDAATGRRCAFQSNNAIAALDSVCELTTFVDFKELDIGYLDEVAYASFQMWKDVRIFLFVDRENERLCFPLLQRKRCTFQPSQKINSIEIKTEGKEFCVLHPCKVELPKYLPRALDLLDWSDEFHDEMSVRSEIWQSQAKGFPLIRRGNEWLLFRRENELMPTNNLLLFDEGKEALNLVMRSPYGYVNEMQFVGSICLSTREELNEVLDDYLCRDVGNCVIDFVCTSTADEIFAEKRGFVELFSSVVTNCRSAFDPHEVLSSIIGIA